MKKQQPVPVNRPVWRRRLSANDGARQRLFFLFSVLLHDGARGDFFCSLAVAARSLGALFYVLILPLLFLARTPQMFLSWHVLPPVF